MNESISSINDRIKNIITHKNLSNAEFANRIHSNVGTLNNITGGRKSSPSYDMINKIALSFTDIDVNWLITGKGSMLVNDIEVNDHKHLEEPNQTSYRLKTDTDVKTQNIPLYNIEATAGIVQLFNDGHSNQPIGTISVPNLPKCDGAVYITGDSMYPLLKSGDIVMYKTVNNLPDGMFFGEMYLVSLDVDGDEFISVKWLHKSLQGDDYITLVSENRHHAPKEVKLSNVRAMALIKGSIRINSMF